MTRSTPRRAPVGVAIPSRQTTAPVGNLPDQRFRRIPVRVPRKKSDSDRFRGRPPYRSPAAGANSRCVFPPTRTRMKIHRDIGRPEMKATPLFIPDPSLRGAGGSEAGEVCDQQRAARFQHSHHLANRRSEVRDIDKGEITDDQIETRGLELKPLGIAGPIVAGRIAPPCCLEQLTGRVDPGRVDAELPSSILQKRPSPQPTSSAFENPPAAMRPSITGSSTCSRAQSPRSPMDSIHACAESSHPLLICAHLLTDVVMKRKDTPFQPAQPLPSPAACRWRRSREISTS